jgi:uncharacterized protein YndB with AHSA1/START domain
MTTSTDSIKREIFLKATPARVWRALADAKEFGDWFGVTLAGQAFTAGGTVRGNVTHPGYEHVVFEAWVERVEPERLLAFRWHPHAVDPATDYSKEPTTLVEFSLTPAEGGTLLRVVESGFDQVPAARRLQAFEMNSGGWDAQLKNIERHVATP